MMKSFRTRPTLIYTLFFLFHSLKTQDLSLDGYTVFPISTSTNATQNISVSNDVKFALKFSSNPSTGFDWYFTNITYETTKNLVEFLNLDKDGGGQYQSSNTGLMGGGGYSYFLLESSANATGQVVLQFVYKRTWETNGQQTYKGVNVFVTKKTKNS